MYGSFHPRQHEIWVTHAEGQLRERFTKYDENDTALFRAVRSLLTWPNQARVTEAFAAAKADGIDISDLEVYRLDFDPETGLLSRKLLASAKQSEPTRGE